MGTKRKLIRHREQHESNPAVVQPTVAGANADEQQASAASSTAKTGKINPRRRERGISLQDVTGDHAAVSAGLVSSDDASLPGSLAETIDPWQPMYVNVNVSVPAGVGSRGVL